MRLWRWFRRSNRRTLGTCYSCHSELSLCERCAGNYLGAKCSRCTTGLACAGTHGKFWF